ncbi:MAG: hypothetical protein N4A71_10985 [Carboxylicivirga sp.]|jgi:hypothetical protein|nr:hypothetical protein [Carboxylicivirga sp.]
MKTLKMGTLSEFQKQGQFTTFFDDLFNPESRIYRRLSKVTTLIGATIAVLTVIANTYHVIN